MAASSGKRRLESAYARTLIDKAVRSILARQLPDGGFNIYAHGPFRNQRHDQGVHGAEAGRPAPTTIRNLARARERILALGGLQAANSYVKINLSLFGLYPREHAPSIPPELMLLGKLIYEMSSWTRAIVIPLSVLHAMNPRRPVPAGFTLKELFAPGRAAAISRTTKDSGAGAISSSRPIWS